MSWLLPQLEEMLHLVYFVLHRMPDSTIKGTYSTLASSSSPSADSRSLEACFQARNQLQMFKDLMCQSQANQARLAVLTRSCWH